MCKTRKLNYKEVVLSDSPKGVEHIKSWCLYNGLGLCDPRLCFVHCIVLSPQQAAPLFFILE